MEVLLFVVAGIRREETESPDFLSKISAKTRGAHPQPEKSEGQVKSPYQANNLQRNLKNIYKNHSCE